MSPTYVPVFTMLCSAGTERCRCLYHAHIDPFVLHQRILVHANVLILTLDILYRIHFAALNICISYPVYYPFLMNALTFLMVTGAAVAVVLYTS